MTLIPADKPAGFVADIKSAITLIVIIWVVFLIGLFLPIGEFGIKPRSLAGLIGIVTMPFQHQDLGHIMSNTVPLIVLLFFVAGIRAPTTTVVASVILIGGVLLWLFGRNANHIGASLLVFGLCTYLIANGYFQRKFHLIIVSIIVVVLYGGTLLFGIVPGSQGSSWDGHLAGAIAGIITAKILNPRLSL